MVLHLSGPVASPVWRGFYFHPVKLAQVITTSSTLLFVIPQESIRSTYLNLYNNWMAYRPLRGDKQKT